jgi:hypothetical protein
VRADSAENHAIVRCADADDDAINGANFRIGE